MKIVHHLLNNKIFDMSKLKTFADNKIIVYQTQKFHMGGWKTLWEKEKMLVTSFQKLFFSGSLKVEIVWYRVKANEKVTVEQRRNCLDYYRSILFYFISVTLARAIELGHSSSLIAALANETSQLYQRAGLSLNICLFVYLGRYS